MEAKTVIGWKAPSSPQQRAGWCRGGVCLADSTPQLQIPASSDLITTSHSWKLVVTFLAGILDYSLPCSPSQSFLFFFFSFADSTPFFSRLFSGLLTHRQGTPLNCRYQYHYRLLSCTGLLIGARTKEFSVSLQHGTRSGINEHCKMASDAPNSATSHLHSVDEKRPML